MKWRQLTLPDAGKCLILLTLLQWTAACTTAPNVVVSDTRKSYPPTDRVQILRSTPQQSYETLANVEASGGAKTTMGRDKTSIIKELGHKAKSIGAHAVIITEETESVSKRDISYTIKGVAIRYSGETYPPAGSSVPAGTVAPASPARTPAARGSSDWLSRQNPEYFTIQLIASHSQQSINRYIEEQNLGGQVATVKTQSKGSTWFALVYGSFPNRKAAKAAIHNLPPAVRKASPWVRKLGDIQKLAVN